MRASAWIAGLTLALSPVVASAQDQTPSVTWGKHISIIGGCHDCHTPGYSESNGKIAPAVALIGNPVGFNGPWGTTYPANLRLMAQKQGSEDAWVQYLDTLKTRPIMPWYNVREMTERDKRSLYRYIVSLGAPGNPAPDYVPPGRVPSTPYVVEAPPHMPGK